MPECEENEFASLSLFSPSRAPSELQKANHLSGQKLEGQKRFDVLATPTRNRVSLGGGCATGARVSEESFFDPLPEFETQTTQQVQTISREVLNQLSLAEYRGYLAQMKDQSVEVPLMVQRLAALEISRVPHIRRLLSQHSLESPYRVMELCELVGLSPDVLNKRPWDLTDSEVSAIKSICEMIHEKR